MCAVLLGSRVTNLGNKKETLLNIYFIFLATYLFKISNANLQTPLINCTDVTIFYAHEKIHLHI